MIPYWTANANGIYRVEGASKDVKITVKGLESVTYTVTLVQATKGGYIHFTEDGSDGSLTLPCSKQISVTAVPDLNYKFGGWKNGSQANPGIFTITSDTILEAVFVPDAKYFTITLPVLEGVAVKPLSVIRPKYCKVVSSISTCVLQMDIMGRV